MIALCLASGDPAREKERAAALCAALVEQVFGDPALLGREASGRPRLKVPGADLSLAHSAGAVLVALSVKGDLPPLNVAGATVTLLDEETDAVGVDLEADEGKDAARCLRIARRFFTPGEAARLEALSDPAAVKDAFLTLWTQKEAAVKATGEGLKALSGVDTEAHFPGRRFRSWTTTLDGHPFHACLCMMKNA